MGGSSRSNGFEAAVDVPAPGCVAQAAARARALLTDCMTPPHIAPLRRSVFAACLVLWVAGSGAAQAEADRNPPDATTARSAAAARPLDHSGQPREGKASWYGKGFVGKPMADGTPMDPASNNAASKTLPLGTTAKVTNLDNGKSAVVEIRDRGPYVPGRIVDVSPHTAQQLGLLDKGVAPVVVAPIEVPQPDGSVRPGTAAAMPEQSSARE
jgi:rare lipoprotein A